MRSIPVWFVLVWNFHCSDSSILTSISSSALFEAQNSVLRKRKKPSSQNRRTAGKGRRKVSALFENRKSRNFYGCYATKIPADSHMIIFWKRNNKSSALFEILSETKKGTANIFAVSGWACSKSVSKGVCIYGIAKNRVNILSQRIKQLSSKFSMFTCKKRFRCNLFQVASKVLNKHGAASQIWTGDLILTKDALYRLSYSSIFTSLPYHPDSFTII